MTSSFGALSTLCIMVSIAGWAGPARAEANAEFPAEALYEKFQARLNADDAEGWLALWTEDGVQMPDGVAPVVGKTAIREGLLRKLKRVRYDMDVTVTEARVLGDIAYAWGTYTVTFTSKADGTSWPLLGTYLTLWQRQADGGWKVYRDIFNEIGPHAVE